MKSDRFIRAFVATLICVSLHMEAEAVRPPLKPLDSDQLRKLIVDADVIATGTVVRVNRSKSSQPPLETIVIRVIMTPDGIFKGDKSIKTIEIEESYQQFSSGKSDDGTITARTAGPAPPVGRYRDGDRILVFLKSTGGHDRYSPLGSGNHDAYLGVLRITSDGVKSDRYPFDEVVSGYAEHEENFLNFIISMQRE